MVKLLSVIFSAYLLTSCGDFLPDIKPVNGDIPPDTIQGPVGPVGPAGQDGQDGQDAMPCSVTQHSDGATITCPDGSVAEIYHGKEGHPGRDGQDGQDGQDGLDGLDGANGADGQDGTDGIDGQDGLDGKDGVDGQDGQDAPGPIYIGYYCSKTVLRIGSIFYVIKNELVPLNSAWLEISRRCSLRVKNGQIEVRD